MFLNRNNKKLLRFLLGMIVFLQILTIVYLGYRKTNYYIDELYSMGYAHNFTGTAGDSRYITEGSSWQHNTWCNVDDFKAQLIVHKNESILSQPFFKALYQSVKYRNYFALLNLSESLICPGQISKWGGIVLNILIFCVFQFALLRFFCRLHIRRCFLPASMIMFGFSGYILSLSVFIRFYLLTNLFLLLILHLHLIMLESNRHSVFFTAELASVFLMYLSFKNSELTLITSGFLILAFSFLLIIQKRWLPFLCYSVPIIAGALIYLIHTTFFLDLLIHPSLYTANPFPVGALSRNVMSTSADEVYSYFRYSVLSWIKSSLFGSKAIMFGFCFVVLCLFLLPRRVKNNLRCRIQFQYMLVISFVFFVYNIFIVLIRPPAADFASRYYSFALLLLFVMMWYIIDRLSRRLKTEADLKKVVVLMSLLAVSAAVITQHRNLVEYTYLEDQEALSNLEQYGTMDTILLDKESLSSSHTSYECVLLRQPGTRLYPTTNSSFALPEEGLPDEFLVWTPPNCNYDEIWDKLTLSGYRVNYLCSTHVSFVYTCHHNPTE